MIQKLDQIVYRRGMLEKGMKPENLPVKVWRRADIPADVRAMVNEEKLLDLGGVYGDKKAGDPVEYDNLKLILTPACHLPVRERTQTADARGAGRDDTIEITVYNRGIALFTTDDERVRRIHRVLCKLDGSGKD
ncbi:MAG: hypothetical protein Kow00122_14030 [Thermoleophilia bacterium]